MSEHKGPSLCSFLSKGDKIQTQLNWTVSISRTASRFRGTTTHTISTDHGIRIKVETISEQFTGNNLGKDRE